MADAAEFERSNAGWRASLQAQEWTEGWEYQWQRLGDWWEQLWPDRPPQEVPDWSWNFGFRHWSDFWAGLVVMVILGLGFWALYRVLRQYWRLAPLYRGRVPQASPLAQSQTVADWLAQARQAQQRGQYGLACQALYQATLQHLHNRELLPQQSSRTDGEYLAALRQQPQAIAYQVVIQTHEQLAFGEAIASEATWSRCQAAYQNIAQDMSPSGQSGERAGES